MDCAFFKKKKSFPRYGNYFPMFMQKFYLKLKKNFFLKTFQAFY